MKNIKTRVLYKLIMEKNLPSDNPSILRIRKLCEMAMGKIPEEEGWEDSLEDDLDTFIREGRHLEKRSSTTTLFSHKKELDMIWNEWVVGKQGNRAKAERAYEESGLDINDVINRVIPAIVHLKKTDSWQKGYIPTVQHFLEDRLFEGKFPAQNKPDKGKHTDLHKNNKTPETALFGAYSGKIHLERGPSDDDRPPWE